MKNFRAFLLTLSFAVAVMFLASSYDVKSQSFNLPGGTSFTNMMVPQGGVPVGTGCTIVAGSTDASGACLTTATSGSIAFSRTYSSAPNCIVVDRTATPVAAYSVAVGAITLSALTSAHNLVWDCKTPAY